MKTLLACLAVALLSGCTSYPDLYESGYYTPGSCSNGLCTLPSSVYGRFPKAPPDSRPLCTEKLLARHADCHW